METDSKIKMAMNIQIIIDDIRNAESLNVRNNLNTSVPSKETKKVPLVHIQMAATIRVGRSRIFKIISRMRLAVPAHAQNRLNIKDAINL